MRGCRPSHHNRTVRRFRAGGEISRVGRTRTAPGHRAVDKLRFASCQSYPSGYYAAYRHMAREDLDLVVHLGDYIYAGAPASSGVRRHEGDGEPMTLTDYRDRHAQYKSDPDLQDAHAAFPFTVTWDDHEVDNNWAALDPAGLRPPVARGLRPQAHGCLPGLEYSRPGHSPSTSTCT